MAVTPNTDAAFLREVDEELRRDQLARALRRYGLAVAGAVLAALLAFGAWQLWQAHRHSVAGEDGEALSKAFDDLSGGHPDAAKAALVKLDRSDVAGYRALARITQADMLVQKQDLRGAAALFAQVAADTEVGQPLRDLALVRRTTAEFDTIKPEIVVSRLRGLAVKDGPWIASAGELVAAAYLRMNRRDLAGRMFAQIARSEGIPETSQQRAVQMAGVLGVDAIDQGSDRAADSKAK